jgi:hypothetical protein
VDGDLLRVRDSVLLLDLTRRLEKLRTARHDPVDFPVNYNLLPLLGKAVKVRVFSELSRRRGCPAGGCPSPLTEAVKSAAPDCASQVEVWREVFATLPASTHGLATRVANVPVAWVLQPEATSGHWLPQLVPKAHPASAADTLPAGLLVGLVNAYLRYGAGVLRAPAAPRR